MILPPTADFRIEHTDDTYTVDKFLEQVNWPKLHIIITYWVVDVWITEIFIDNNWSTARIAICQALSLTDIVFVNLHGGVCVNVQSKDVSTQEDERDD